MAYENKLVPSSLQTKVIAALEEAAKIRGMKKALAPVTEALATRIMIPEGDFKNVAKFVASIIQEYGHKMKTDGDALLFEKLLDVAELNQSSLKLSSGKKK